MLGRTQIPPDRGQAGTAPRDGVIRVRQTDAREPSTGGEGGPGFDQALDTALEVGSEASAAAAAMVPGMQQAPAPAEALKGSFDPESAQAPGTAAEKPMSAEMAGAKEALAKVRQSQARMDRATALEQGAVTPVSAGTKTGEAAGAAPGSKLASVQAQDNVLARQAAASTLEERSAGGIASLMSSAKPWDSVWIREGMPRPDAEAKPSASGAKSVASETGAALTGPAGNPLSASPSAQVMMAQALGAVAGQPGTVATSTSDSAMLQGMAAAGAARSLQGTAGNSTFEGVEIQSMRAFAELPEDAPAPKAAAKVLGGSDFLNMLQDVKNGTATDAASEAARQPTSFGRATDFAMQGQAADTAAKSAATAAAATQVPQHSVAREPGIREIGGAPIKRERDTARAATVGAGIGGGTSQAPAGGPAVEVSGQVVPGPMSRDRLATASVANLSAGISGLKGQGGGEMKLRLKPESLGEIQLQVTTHGNQVAVKVHASSNQAKEILEESLSALKDSLAGHKLMLGKIEIVTGNQAADAGSGAGQQQSQQSQFAGDFGGHRNPDSSRDMGGDGGRSSRGRESRDDLSPGITTAIPSARRMAAASSGARASGRLDVMA